MAQDFGYYIAKGMLILALGNGDACFSFHGSDWKRGKSSRLHHLYFFFFFPFFLSFLSNTLFVVVVVLLFSPNRTFRMGRKEKWESV